MNYVCPKVNFPALVATSNVAVPSYSSLKGACTIPSYETMPVSIPWNSDDKENV